MDKSHLNNDTIRPRAVRFVVLLGFVSLFADMTYEAARSISGPYLGLLGASGFVVGLTAGAGELLGYGLRYFFGLLGDKTRRYWTITLIGYAVNLLAVPLLGLAGHWPLAMVLMLTERIGKAIRTPARDVMLSYATATVGRGWGFAIHEAMDQIGAMLGPVIVMVVLAYQGSYPCAFAVLAIPAVLALSVLVAARISYPQPQHMEGSSAARSDERLPREFWLYLAAVGCVAAGFADYPLIAFHIQSQGLMGGPWIPLLYACAMGIDALAALVFGRWYDKKGMTVLAAAVVVSSVFAIFAFSMNWVLILMGVVLWGVGMGAQESIIRAAVADLVPKGRRGTGFGIFNAGYGLAWFLGSMLMGVFYDISLPALISFSILSQLAFLPIWIGLGRKMSRS